MISIFPRAFRKVIALALCVGALPFVFYARAYASEETRVESQESRVESQESRVEGFWDEYKRLHSPHRYKVDLSEGLYTLKSRLLGQRKA